MKNILTIYKLNLPFGEGSLYDITKYRSICNELEWFLKYKEEYIGEEKKKYKEFEVLNILFAGGKIKIIFYYENKHLFLPSFQIDLFSEKILDKSFLQGFYKVFTALQGDEYIFDIITPKLILKSEKIVTDYTLAKTFDTFSEKKLETFLKNIDVFFLEEKLEQNPEMKQHLYYLIFLNYKLFKNILLSDGGISDLEKLLGEDIDDEFMAELSISKERIEHISQINIAIFEKYKKMLEKLVALLV